MSAERPVEAFGDPTASGRDLLFADEPASLIGAHAKDEKVVAVVETDMCGVDAIQFLTAFSFFRRSDGRAVRS